MAFRDQELSRVVVSAARVERMRLEIGADNTSKGFAEFMAKVDRVITVGSGVFGVFDFADAPWADLFENCGDTALIRDVFDTLSEYDDIFAQLVAIRFPETEADLASD